MKFYVLASSASILLGAVLPGVFSSEEYNLRGSTSAVAKSIESFDEFLHDASAAIAGHDFDENDCKNYKPGDAKDDKCSEAYTGCCASTVYDKNDKFCKCAGFGKAEGIILVDTPWTFNAAGDEKCDTTAGVKYTCTYDAQPVSAPEGSSVAKPMESFDEVLHDASAAIVGKDFDKNKCDHYNPEDTKQDECSEAYTACCASTVYDKNKDFCECAGFDKPKGIILVDTPWSFNSVPDEEKCGQYTCTYDDADDADGPPASAVSKSIESFDEVLHDASAAIVGKDFDEDDCKNYKPENAKNDDCHAAYTGCCASTVYDKNDKFCKCAGFDKAEGIILVDTPWTFNAAGDEKCDTTAGVKYTCTYDDDDDADGPPATN